MSEEAGRQQPQKKKRREGRKERPVIEPIPSHSSENSKFARALGSSDPLTRRKAVTALQRWLQIRSSVKEAELVRIWKGLFYCFWHSDLVPVQVCVLSSVHRGGKLQWICWRWLGVSRPGVCLRRLSG